MKNLLKILLMFAVVAYFAMAAGCGSSRRSDDDKQRVVVVERKEVVVIHKKDPFQQIAEQNYLNQLEEIGEDIDDYESIWGYSIGETEPRMSLYEYPDYEFNITEEYTNLELETA